MSAPRSRAAGRVRRLRYGPLSARSFRLLAAGQLTSTVGDYCYAVALPWLVLSVHGGTVLLGAVLACYGVPQAVLIPVGGMLADKTRTRTVMLTADAARCCVAAALAVAAARHVTSLALLGPLAALLGAGAGLFIPASFAIMPSLLEPRQLRAGNAINAAVVQSGSIAGPVLGGLLVALAGPAPALAADAASFAVSAVTLALIQPRTTATAQGAIPAPTLAVPAAPPASGDETIWSLLRRARVLQVYAVMTIAGNLGLRGTLGVALPALAHANFGAGGYGALMACLGAGAVTGTLTAASGRRLSRPAVAAASCYVTQAMALALIPFLGGLQGAAAAAFALGACNGLGNVIMVTLIQQWAPPRLLGRVMSVVMLCSMGSYPLSVAASGALVRRLGPSPFFPAAAALVAAAVLGALTQRQFRDLGTTPAQPAGDSATQTA